MEHKSEELEKKSWASYLTELSRDNPALEVSIEIIGGEVGHGIEATALRFEDAVYDERSDVFEISGSRTAGSSRQVLRHLVSQPRTIWVADGTGLPTAIEVDHGDGTRTLIRLAPE